MPWARFVREQASREAGQAAVDGAVEAWLDGSVRARQGLTPREAAASDDQVDVFRLESPGCAAGLGSGRPAGR